MFALLFGHEVDGSEGEDLRDFEGAAGSRVIGEERRGGDRVRFEDIPHSSFSSPGLRRVDGLGSRAEEIIYYRPEDPEDTDYTEKPNYEGAAGESSIASDKRHEREQLASKKKLRSTSSATDKLLFGLEEDYEEGEGGDVPPRRCRMTDELLYGCHAVVGEAHILPASHDPRELEGSAGNSTKELSQRFLATIDISQRPERAVTTVHASEVDELIFGGRNIDMSGEDERDFSGAAGQGEPLSQAFLSAWLDVTSPYILSQCVSFLSEMC